MKKIISLLTIVALIAVLATAAFAAEEPALYIADVTAAAGDEVIMNIEIVNNPGLSLGEFVFNFDTTALEFVSATAVGGDGWAWICMVNDQVDNAKFGSVVFSASDAALTGDAVLVTLTLKVKEDVKPGSYPVNAVVDFIGDDEGDFIVGTTFTGYVNIPCPGHVWDEGVVKTPATCKDEGVMVYTCTLCGETKEEAIATVDHTWGEWEVTTPATCGAEGVETRTCSVCGETETRAIAALEHAWVETERVEATGCTAGKVVYTCSNCGETKEEVLPAAGEHTWAETERVEATCCENGKVVYTCSVCGETKEEVLTATGEHELTYVDNGENHKIVCATSGKELGVEDHVYGDFVEDPENPGWKFQVCEKCGHQHKEEVPTGDNSMIAVATALISMMGIVALVAKKEF